MLPARSQVYQRRWKNAYEGGVEVWREGCSPLGWTLDTCVSRWPLGDRQHLCSFAVPGRAE